MFILYSGAMARKSKLLAALYAHKGGDYKVEKQKKMQKEAEKRKRSRATRDKSNGEEDENIKTELKGDSIRIADESDGWESAESEESRAEVIDTSRMIDSDSDNSSEESLEQGGLLSAAINAVNGTPLTAGKEDGNEEEDIPLSDIESLASDDKADVLPHQRLTINNTTALLAAHKSIAPSLKLPFSAHQTLLSSSPVAIADVNDDLTRELAFYKQCLDSANEARILLKKEGVQFSRPNDYFAEMVKSDEHMGKIKQKITDEATNKKAAAEARKQRDLKKFGKQVQVARLQERDRQKKDMLGKIDILKRKRKNADVSAPNEEDLVEVALEDASKAEKADRSARNGSKRGDRGRGPPSKRQKKDERYGFGGKKRFAKSGDAASSGDLRGFSATKMKGQNKGSQRLGKSRRARI
ncbi:MAG: rRNA-processing protein and EBNA1-binding protein ebp2 [Heterodermia speciosa]|uniref:rRNA-processing protein and EBNA1-binding protein ebp2 n=1 Tax=Heterodermia speciosa TaxID=116794 RepID=A0A8H3HVN1_9LECA|nr:MAG: rRNA-processing protein and EBNA1-binding protein ebp2 [Heterodermia speciosa]